MKAISFHSLYPVPDIIVMMGFDPNGYDWCCSHWGTKWDTYGEPQLVEHEEGLLTSYATFTYRSAWGIAREFLIKISKDYPDLLLAISYVVEGPSRGRLLLADGMVSQEKSGDKPPKWDNDKDEETQLEEYEKWRDLYYRNHERWLTRYLLPKTVPAVMGSLTA
jgi:hypothetical protein